MRHLLLIAVILGLGGCGVNSWKSPNTPTVRLSKPEPICTQKAKQAIKGYFFPCIELVCAKGANEPKSDGVAYCTRDKKGKIQSLHVRAFSAVSICIDSKAQILGVRLENCQNFIGDMMKHQDES